MNGPARYLTDSILAMTIPITVTVTVRMILTNVVVLTPHPLHLRGVVLPLLQS